MTTEPRRAGAQMQSSSSRARTAPAPAPAASWQQLLPASDAGRRGVTTRATAAASTGKRKHAARAAAPGATTASSAPPQLPDVRSGHAMTLLRPTESVLLFGGSDGDVFLNDFFVLEPSHYAALSETQYSNASEISLEMSAVGEIAGLSQSSAASCDEEELALMQSQRAPAGSSQTAAPNEPEESAEPPLSLQWKPLVVTFAPTPHASTSPFFAAAAPADHVSSSENHTSSLGSQDSQGSSLNSSLNNSVSHSNAAELLPYVGMGRDYHTMHYVPASRDEESQRGMRVLVLGNILVAAQHEAKRFEVDEFRIDEVRVRQPMLEAQWVPRKLRSQWTPRARHAHSSVLIGDHIYCFGGKDACATTFYNDLFYFDVRLNEWQNPPSTGSFPSPRSYAGLAATGDKIFMYGGYDGRQQFGGIFVYDVRLHRWDKVVALGEKPTSRMNLSLTFLPPHHLVMFGGRDTQSRKNDVSLFDTTTNTWKMLSPDSGSAQGTSSTNSTQGSSSSRSNSTHGLAATPKLAGRTAHAVVHYDVSGSTSSSRTARRKKPTAEKFLIFGGYAGMHRWLNDLQLLAIPTEILQPPSATTSAPQTQATRLKPTASSLSLRYREDKPRAVSAPAQYGSSQSQSQSLSQTQSQSQSQSQQHRPSSRTDTPSVLADITNQTVQTHVPLAAAYTPATDGAFSSKRPLKPSSQTALSTDVRSHSKGVESSQSLTSRDLKKRKRVVDTQDSLSSGELISSQVSTQTAIIQLLQHSERVEEGQANILAMIADVQALHQQDACFHLEKVEKKLDAATLKIDALEKQLRRCEDEKSELREQLVASNAELFVHRQTLGAAPKLKDELLEAFQHANHCQITPFIESRVSSIYEMLGDMRHASGERTETDDSPQKKDSMFPDDPKSQPHMYPERVVINLEERLRSALAANDILEEALKAKDADMTNCLLELSATQERLKHSEENLERIRHSLAWLQPSE